MAGILGGERFRFLYRQAEGTIDRRQFWLASWPPCRDRVWR